MHVITTCINVEAKKTWWLQLMKWTNDLVHVTVSRHHSRRPLAWKTKFENHVKPQLYLVYFNFHVWRKLMAYLTLSRRMTYINICRAVRSLKSRTTHIYIYIYIYVATSVTNLGAILFTPITHTAEFCFAVDSWKPDLRCVATVGPPCPINPSEEPLFYTSTHTSCAFKAADLTRF